MLLAIHNVHCYPGIPSLVQEIFEANKVQYIVYTCILTRYPLIAVLCTRELDLWFNERSIHIYCSLLFYSIIILYTMYMYMHVCIMYMYMHVFRICMAVWGTRLDSI